MADETLLPVVRETPGMLAEATEVAIELQVATMRMVHAELLKHGADIDRALLRVGNETAGKIDLIAVRVLSERWRSRQSDEMADLLRQIAAEKANTTD